MKVSLDLDTDVHAKVSKFANGVGVELSEVIEKAIVFALRSRYPSNELPDRGRPTDPDYGIDEGRGERPDQGLPGSGGRPDNSLPGAPARPDQGPVDPDSGTKPVEPEEPEGGTKPGEPVNGMCPVFDPSVDNELPEAPVPEPK